MGLFKKLKKGLKGALKIAKVVAPIAAGFFPGGSAAMNIIGAVSGGGGGAASGKWGGIMNAVGKVQRARKRLAPAINLAGKLREAKQVHRAIPGSPTFFGLACSTCSTNGTSSRLGTTYARQIAAFRRAGGIRSKTKRYSYTRARRFARSGSAMGKVRARGGRRLRAFAA